MPRETVLAYTAQANVAVRMNNIKLAEAALRDARDTPERPGADAELNSRMREVEGWIAFIQGDFQRARLLFQQSHEEGLKAFGPFHAKIMDALRGRIYAEQQLRNYDGALSLLEQLDTTAARTKGVDAGELASLAVDRTDLLLFAGRYAELLDHVVPAFAKCATDLGPNHATCRTLLVRKFNVMLRLGLTIRASDDRSAIETIADDKKAPALGAEASILLLKLDSLAPSVERRSASFERVITLGQSGPDVSLSSYYKARALLALAEATLRSKDPADADNWIRQALSLQRRDDGSVPTTTLSVLAKNLQGVSLLQHGQPKDALENLLSARDDLSKLVGADHPASSLCSLNVAIALHALDRVKEALAIVEGAEPILRKSMGPDAPVYLRATELRSQLIRASASETSTLRGPDLSKSDVGVHKISSSDFFS
jgi:tetratricopeptide (TPR) repeat protein